MARAKAPTAAAGALLPDGRTLTQAIRQLVEDGGRPRRMDEFVSDTGCSVDEIQLAIAKIAEEDGDPLSATFARLVLVDDFDNEPAGSILDQALAEATGPMATGYENGEVVDRPVAKKATTEQPAFANMPETLAWGTHNGLRVTHGEGKFRGSITLPDRLAEMSNDEEVIFTVRAKYDYDGYRRDPKQEGRTSTLHKNVTLAVLTVELMSGPLPPSQS